MPTKLMVLLTIISAQSFAGGSSGSRGGGDANALEFYNTARKIVGRIQQECQIESVKNASMKTLADTISAVDVIMTEDPLYIDTRRVDAINYPDLMKIEVNRLFWISANPITRQTITIHEYLGILRIDDRGYRLSTEIITTGQNCIAPSPSLPPIYQVPGVSELIPGQTYTSEFDECGISVMPSYCKSVFDRPDDGARVCLKVIYVDNPDYGTRCRNQGDTSATLNAGYYVPNQSYNNFFSDQYLSFHLTRDFANESYSSQVAMQLQLIPKLGISINQAIVEKVVEGNVQFRSAIYSVAKPENAYKYFVGVSAPTQGNWTSLEDAKQEVSALSKRASDEAIQQAAAVSDTNRNQCAVLKNNIATSSEFKSCGLFDSSTCWRYTVSAEATLKCKVR